MDKPTDPATPLKEVYQAFYADQAKEGTKTSTIDRYRYNIGRFEKWLRTILIAYKQHLETLPQQPRGSIRRRRGGLARLAMAFFSETPFEQFNWVTELGDQPLREWEIAFCDFAD